MMYMAHMILTGVQDSGSKVYQNKYLRPGIGGEEADFGQNKTTLIQNRFF